MEMRVSMLALPDNSFDDRSSIALLIDDSAAMQKLLSLRLRNDGLDVISAMSGEEGVRAAQEQLPSVILLDLGMPGMDGFEVLRTLKDNEATLHIPVIMLSGVHNSHDKVTAFDLGAVDFITKPFDVTELRVRVRSALRVSYLMQMLSQRAQIDGLTGLYNRAHFDHRWAEEVAAVNRHKRPLTIAMLDLDHFKSVNDTFGHPAGDAVIQGLARIIRRECRQTDVACRYGGEEIVLIMPETVPADAAAVCERIRVALADVVWPKHPERSVTCSIGVVGTDGTSAAEPLAWLELADKNLYRAKREGRNRVVTSALENGMKLAQVG